MTGTPPAPAGWYPLAGGGKRFWDGTRWTPDVLGTPTRSAEYAALASEMPPPAYAVAPLQQGPSQPAGWYPSPSGLMQWWDGRAWGPYSPQAMRPMKDVGVAYLFFLFLGGFGAHRFYLGRAGSAVVLLLLWLIGWMLSFFLIGVPLVIAAGIWLLVDLFLIPSMVREENSRIPGWR